MKGGGGGGGVGGILHRLLRDGKLIMCQMMSETFYNITFHNVCSDALFSTTLKVLLNGFNI